MNLPTSKQFPCRNSVLDFGFRVCASPDPTYTTLIIKMVSKSNSWDTKAVCLNYCRFPLSEQYYHFISLRETENTYIFICHHL